MTSPGKMKSLFTLRGHDKGVTSLAYCQLPDDHKSYLISGDEEGTLIFWNLETYKQAAKIKNIFQSTIQSVKEVKLIVKNKGLTSVLVVQSRNDGVKVLDFYEPPDEIIKLVPDILASYPTYESLFSRGDAKSTQDGRIIIAHPSILENYLVTVRVLGRDAKTELSGTAGKYEPSEKKHPVFDIVIDSSDTGGINHLFVAHEDGYLNIYQFQLDTTQTLPVLNSEGLDIQLVRRIDLGFKDFVAAYDVKRIPLTRDYLIVAGSPGKDLCFIRCSMNFDSEPHIDRLKLKTSGVSAISLRPDVCLVSIACWDKSVKFYSIDTGSDSFKEGHHSLLATLDQHNKQIQAILFTPKPITSSLEDKNLVFCASKDGTISIY